MKGLETKQDKGIINRNMNHTEGEEQRNKVESPETREASHPAQRSHNALRLELTRSEQVADVRHKVTES